MTPNFIHSLIDRHAKTIQETAIKNCHVTGLHSFLISKSPKIRLFIADKECKLRLPFDYKNPYLTIHQHKHNDLFIPLTKTQIIHHLYEHVEFFDDECVALHTNQYNRLNQVERKGKIGGSDNLRYLGPTTKKLLMANEFHTVSIPGGGKCAWLIIEFGTVDNFVQLSYGGEQVTDDCYQPFPNAVEYIKDFFNKV